MDPIHQFQIVNLFPVLQIGNTQIAFTNAAAFMFLGVICVTAFLIGATAGNRLVPNRLQSMAELTYEFTATMVRSTAGAEGMKFFPYVFTIFMFVLFLNIVGEIPYAFSVTSQVVITSTLALMVFFTVLTYGIMRHGVRFFNLFVPKGVPIYILPMIVAIEIMSFISRPVSHSIRLFANMLAGHITVKVFAGFIILLGTGLGAIGWAGGIFPFFMVVILFALEFLVAALQAYVFAILTCIYLNDAIHPGH
ncbi:MAG TPA: F0F1 ATP synthase subunit A [Pseudolabrys sp.]|jgi:F-type H+-transporting ATPase subunit a|nr:F0F1 ATP synthase subunit A [Pseudolabrys sp.]